jgi:LPXTG-site transpeptidase (sortase) family protein
MDGLAHITARLIMAGKRAYGLKWSFGFLFMLIFMGSVGTLSTLDLLPEAPTAEATGITEHVTPIENQPVVVSIAEPEEPVKIEIPTLKLSATIANPTSTSIAVLDELLRHGAVRYPGSARLAEDGNVVLFGHSSYLPVVKNPAYRTFNEIQNLKAGDVIIVSSSGKAYTYKVRTVEKENANEGAIPLAVSGKILTLATCNTFASKDDRFIVTADFVESHSLAN